MIAKLLSLVVVPLAQWFITEGVAYFIKAYEEYKIKQLKENVAAKTNDALTNENALEANKSTEDAWKNL